MCVCVAFVHMNVYVGIIPSAVCIIKYVSADMCLCMKSPMTIICYTAIHCSVSSLLYVCYTPAVAIKLMHMWAKH